MDLYKIAFVETFLIAAIGFLIFGSKLRVIEYKVSRFLHLSNKNQKGIAESKPHQVKQ